MTADNTANNDGPDLGEALLGLARAEPQRLTADEPSRDGRSFVAAIRSTFWRRAAMVVVWPALVIWHLWLPLLCALFRLVALAAEGAYRGVRDRIRWELRAREIVVLRVGVVAMWSDGWARDADAAIKAAAERVRADL